MPAVIDKALDFISAMDISTYMQEELKALV